VSLCTVDSRKLFRYVRDDLDLSVESSSEYCRSGGLGEAAALVFADEPTMVDEPCKPA